MKWHHEYKIGIPAIDSQHKRLFELIGDLNEGLRQGLKWYQVKKLLTTLDQYKTRHFQLEEKHMKECDYPGLEEQQKAHAYFTKRFAELGKELETNGINADTVRAIKEELVDWLKDHVGGLDREFGNFYKSFSK